MRAKDKEKEKEKTKLFDLKLDPSFPLYLSFHLPLSLSLFFGIFSWKNDDADTFLDVTDRHRDGPPGKTNLFVTQVKYLFL